ncbi:MAG: ABC transporter permease [Vicinamibacterales bacterium]
MTTTSGLGRFARNPAAVVGGLLVSTFALTAILGPLLVGEDPLRQDLANNFAPPSLAHWLGTDDLGRDAFSRLVHGARISLGISLTSVLCGVGVGTTVGLVSGYYRGLVDRTLMRMVDVMLAFPDILLAIVVVATLGKGLGNTIAAVTFFAVPTFARLARGAALGVVAAEFVTAAQAVGASDARVLGRHVLPNALQPILVQATLMMGTAILIASGLSYLGLGVQPPDPEWGAMLSKGRELLRTAPVVAIAPGIAITLVVLGFSLMGDGLRDALDVRSVATVRRDRR